MEIKADWPGVIMYQKIRQTQLPDPPAPHNTSGRGESNAPELSANLLQLEENPFHWLSFFTYTANVRTISELYRKMYLPMKTNTYENT